MRIIFSSLLFLFFFTIFQFSFLIKDVVAQMKPGDPCSNCWWDYQGSNPPCQAGSYPVCPDNHSSCSVFWATNSACRAGSFGCGAGQFRIIPAGGILCVSKGEVNEGAKCRGASSYSWSAPPNQNQICSENGSFTVARNLTERRESGYWTGWTWTCHSFQGFPDVNCSANLSPGRCGSADGTTRSTAPSTPAERCSAGSSSAVSGTGPWTWSCTGTSCSANKTAITCGTANGGTYPSNFNRNGATMCSDGSTPIPSARMQGGYWTGWTWTCGNSPCYANLSPGRCGDAHLKTLSTAPSIPTDLCRAGALTAGVTDSGTRWTWGCTGGVSCYANKPATCDPTCPNPALSCTTVFLGYNACGNSCGYGTMNCAQLQVCPSSLPLPPLGIDNLAARYWPAWSSSGLPTCSSGGYSTVTSSATWSRSAGLATTAVVGNGDANGPKGQVTAGNPPASASATMRATYSGVSDSSLVTVTVPGKLIICPESVPTLSIGGAPQNLVARYWSSLASTPNCSTTTPAYSTVTNSASWSSSDLGIATVSSTGTRGVVTGVSGGSAVISATYNSLTATKDVTVAAAGGPIVSVGVTATPPSGIVPFPSDIRAEVSGTATGNITYTFDCGNGTTLPPFTSALTIETRQCTYSSSGTYTPKVSVVRQGVPGVGQTTVTANAATYSCTGSVPPTAVKWDTEEETGLLANTGWNYADPDTNTKCQYHCVAGTWDPITLSCSAPCSCPNASDYCKGRRMYDSCGNFCGSGTKICPFIETNP